MRRTLRPLALTLAAAVLAACGDSGALTEPEPSPAPEPEPTTTRLQVDFTNIEVIKDCDGIEGSGDFRFTVTARPSFGSATTVYNANRTMNDGDRTPSIGRRTFSANRTSGQQLTVELRGTEYDKTIFGQTFEDSRMSNASATRAHTYNGDAWSGLGPQTITLGPSDCRVRLNYTVSEVQ